MIALSNESWWKDAVIYQVYPKSFADASGDGIGDLKGITNKLDYLKKLGIDAIWISPFYPSPQLDGGYDVIDYRDVDPMFGTLGDFDELLARAHGHGIRLIVDLVPNHCSWDNPLFQEALAAAPGSPERDLFIFKDGRGPDGSEPPTDWISGAISAWTQVPDYQGQPGQWYLHLFDISQPDWNWENPRVWEIFDQVLRFWLDRGVDGFRVDVSHGLKKDPRWQDWNGSSFGLIPTSDPETRPPFWDQDPVHEVYRHWRSILDEYGKDRILVAEAWLSPDRLSRYVRADEMNQAFNFAYLETPWQAAAMKKTIEATMAADSAVGAPTTWVLSNHDVIRHATRFGYPAGTKLPFGIGPTDDQPDSALGLRRARAATCVMMALPGSAYVYQGEELGLPEAIDIDDAQRQDPHWVRSEGALRGRDGCRAPMPWDSSQENLGFSEGTPWLSVPAEYELLAVDRQDQVFASTLELYRSAIALRKEAGLGRGELEWDDAPADGVLAFRSRSVRVFANTSDLPVEGLLGDTEVLLCSSAVPSDADLISQGVLPANCTVWVKA